MSLEGIDPPLRAGPRERALGRPRTLIEATNALLPYSLSPKELVDPPDVQRRAAAIADLLVRGLRNVP